MTTITLNSRELATVLAALRTFRNAVTGQPDLSDLTPEQVTELGAVFGTHIMTSETGEPIATLEPAEIDDLVDRLKSV